MPNGKSSGKHSSQLLFSEAIAQPKPMAAQTAPPCSASSPTDPHALEVADRILLEIAAVGHRLEAVDSKISDLTLASSSIRADIAGFRQTVNVLDQRLMTMEGHEPTEGFYEPRSLIWRIGVAKTMYAFLAFRNTRRALISKRFSNLSSPNLLVWSSHRLWSSKGSTGLALYIKRPLTSPILSSHVFCAMNRLARSSQQPNPKAHTLWRDTRLRWQRISPD
ncbi:hypothetical protein NDU88_001785 [Pleurodeles waltl]|uniref:Uncharacterized protein n=1 Tax=Pleurodeles waltl TaxID=8319 RepID=A0AAV7P6I0_PLEWA|nr:hypothetical protein NDU88_001785 [Pleurodeles waltl]